MDPDSSALAHVIHELCEEGLGVLIHTVEDLQEIDDVDAVATKLNPVHVIDLVPEPPGNFVLTEARFLTHLAQERDQDVVLTRFVELGQT